MFYHISRVGSLPGHDVSTLERLCRVLFKGLPTSGLMHTPALYSHYDDDGDAHVDNDEYEQGRG